MTDAETIIARVLGGCGRFGIPCPIAFPNDEQQGWCGICLTAAAAARALRDAALLPEATTRVEWGNRHPSGAIETARDVPEWLIRTHVAKHPDQQVIRRIRTEYADHVTEWEPAE